MEEGRERDFRVPIISCSFFLSSLTGGILLTCWLLDVKGSQPWFPIFSLVLIGLPWIFWFLTYIYAFIKPCFRQDNAGGGIHNRAKPAANSARNVSFTFPCDQTVNSPTGKRQVKFGAVVVMGGDRGSGGQSGNSDGGGASDFSGASSSENERPLNLNVSVSS